MTLLEEFENLCKYVREATGSDLVCGLCEYDAGTVGEEPIECPGFDSNECFVLKESLRKQYELYEQVIRCKDCMYKNEYGHCTYYINFHHWTADMDYCSDAERRDKRNG